MPDQDALVTARTDLAIEAKEMAFTDPNQHVEGVESDVKKQNGIEISHVQVTSPQGARMINKAMGNYVNIDAPGLREKDTDLQDEVSQIVARELRELAGFTDDMELLVVGLGNWNVTPDAIGPKVVEDLVLTRRLFELVPDRIGPGFRSLAGVSPGVLGITGLETSEMITGIVNQVKPSMILAIDSLAASKLDRLNTTIQIADNGIHPGSGVGNNRKALNQETLGVPVIAMGVPTVLDASTLVSNVIDMMNLQSPVRGHQQKQEIQQTLQPYGGETPNLMVTPKEVDQFIDDISEVLAGGINAAVHPRIEEENAGKYL